MRPDSSRGRSRTRSQSEIIGFVLVFAAVVAATGTVALLGTTALEDAQATTSASNGEYAMQAVAADAEAMYYGTATSRNTELSLDSASVHTGDSTTITLSDGGGTQLLQRDIQPLVYDSEGADIVYENSAVFREQREGAVALTEPLIAASTERTVIPLLDSEMSTVQSIGGGTHRIHGIIANTDSLIDTTSSSYSLEIETNSAVRADAWKRVLDRQLDSVAVSDCSKPADRTVSCEFDTDTLVVSIVTVRYEFR